MTDCGLKCFELQDTEYALAVENENDVDEWEIYD